jgi:hypothetical protein
VLVVNDDPAVLVNMHNDTGVDVFVWPRVSSNFIFETYVRNVRTVTERALTDQLKEEAVSNKKLKAYLSKQSIGAFAAGNMMSGDALNFMHYVPASATLKFNYDFVGTDQYPVENLTEQLFFMFAVANNKRLEGRLGGGSSLEPYELSPSLCRVYERSLQIDFFNKENKNVVKFEYVAPDAIDESDRTTRVTVERRLISSWTLTNRQAVAKASAASRLGLKLSACVDKITVALNDDNVLSNVQQIEVLRLTTERVCLSLKRFDLASGKSL